MKNKSSLFYILFLLAGLGIIIAAFFLLLKNLQEEKLFYLNLSVSCFVFVTIFLRASDIFGNIVKVSSSGAAYGLRWYGVNFYTPLAILLVVLSILLSWDFNSCLIGHLILIFILLLFFFLGSLVKSSVNASMAKIENRKRGCKELSEQISYLETICRLNQNGTYQEEVNLLKEGIRFITASDKPEAIALEKRLSEKIRLIAHQMEHSSQPADVYHSEFTECMTLIELRKNQF